MRKKKEDLRLLDETRKNSKLNRYTQFVSSQMKILRGRESTGAYVPKPLSDKKTTNVFHNPIDPNSGMFDREQYKIFMAKKHLNDEFYEDEGRVRKDGESDGTGDEAERRSKTLDPQL